MVSAEMFSMTGWQHDVLGWMFTYLIHSSVLILVVYALTRVLTRMSLDTKETMWRLALFGGLLTSMVQVGFGLTPLPGNLDMPAAMVAQAQDDAAAPSIAATAGPQAVVDRRIIEHREGELTITTVREKKATAAVVGAVGPRKASSWPWVILGLVAAGSLFALGRLAWAARVLARQLAGRRDVTEDPALETHLALCAKAELKKRPRLTASSKLRSPVALWNNEICLPERAVDSLSPQQQQGMLAHELAHIIRRDPTWRIAIAAFEAVFFFQPLNHLARRKLNEVAEFQCDEWAATNTGTGVHLAKCLAEVASWLDGGPVHSPIVTAMAAPNSPIVQRITRLLGHPHARPHGGAGVRVALAVFAMGAVAWFVPGVSAAEVRHQPEASAVTVAVAGTDALRFEDASDAGFDRSTLHLDHGDERVQVHVESRKALPPPPPVREAPLRSRRNDRLEIVIRGGLWTSGFPWCMGGCDGGLFLDLGWSEALDALDELDEFDALDDLDEAADFGRTRRWVEPAPERAEPARAILSL